MLPHAQEEKFFKEVEYIVHTMSSLTEYYDKLGFNYGAAEDILALLKQSIENSKRKKYHG
jgi:hypothetical protein